MCPGCGIPRRDSWDPRNEGEFEVEEHHCLACSARESRSESRDKPGLYRTIKSHIKPQVT